MPQDALNWTIRLPAPLLAMNPVAMIQPENSQSMFALLFPGSSFHELASLRIY